MNWVEKVRDYLSRILLIPPLEYPFSTSQAQKAHNKIFRLKFFARILMLLLFGLGGILVAIGSDQVNTDVTNIGIGILASGLVSLIFLSYESYNARISVLRSRANYLDSLSRFIYYNIPEIIVHGEPARTYSFSQYIHLQHRMFHDYFKKNETIDSEGDKLLHALSSYVLYSEDRMQALFSNYSFLALQEVFDKRELDYLLGFRDSFQRTRNSIQRNDSIQAIYNFSIYLDLISSMVMTIGEMNVFNKMTITLDESGQAVFNRTEFYACEKDFRMSDEFIARRSANYAKMRHEEKASVEKE